MGEKFAKQNYLFKEFFHTFVLHLKNIKIPINSRRIGLKKIQAEAEDMPSLNLVEVEVKVDVGLTK